MTASSPTKFAMALRAFFAQHLPLTRGLSPRTVLSYRDTFVLLLRFLATHHGCGVVDLELDHLRAGDVLLFLDHLETKEEEQCRDAQRPSGRDSCVRALSSVVSPN